jgi:hypothetical protein
MKCKICNKLYTITVYKNKIGSITCPHCYYGFNSISTNKVCKGIPGSNGVQDKQGKQYTHKKKKEHSAEGVGRSAGV